MQIGAMATARLLIMLRRIWKSIDRLADIEHEWVALEKERLKLEYPLYGAPPKERKKTEIGVAELEDLNKRWKEGMRRG